MSSKNFRSADDWLAAFYLCNRHRRLESIAKDRKVKDCDALDRDFRYNKIRRRDFVTSFERCDQALNKMLEATSTAVDNGSGQMHRKAQ